jgi:hypothetical protein
MYPDEADIESQGVGETATGARIRIRLHPLTGGDASKQFVQADLLMVIVPNVCQAMQRDVAQVHV